jgi:hypothetical protein
MLTLKLAACALVSQGVRGESDEGFMRRRLQATGMNVCGTETSVSSAPGTFYDDQPNIGGSSVDCTTGVCDGLDATCLGGVCTHQNGYGDNLDCGKQVVAPVGNNIRFIFSSLTLEQHPTCPGPDGACDWVSVYDGPDATAPLLGEFGGTVLPPPMVTTSNYGYVHFHTDAGKKGGTATRIHLRRLRAPGPARLGLNIPHARNTGNYGLHLSGVPDDPGFFIDWSFIENVVAGTCFAVITVAVHV